MRDIVVRCAGVERVAANNEESVVRREHRRHKNEVRRCPGRLIETDVKSAGGQPGDNPGVNDIGSGGLGPARVIETEPKDATRVQRRDIRQAKDNGIIPGAGHGIGPGGRP